MASKHHEIVNCGKLCSNARRILPPLGARLQRELNYLLAKLRIADAVNLRIKGADTEHNVQREAGQPVEVIACKKSVGQYFIYSFFGKYHISRNSLVLIKIEGNAVENVLGRRFRFVKDNGFDFGKRKQELHNYLRNN